MVHSSAVAQETFVDQEPNWSRQEELALSSMHVVQRRVSDVTSHDVLHAVLHPLGVIVLLQKAMIWNQMILGSDPLMIVHRNIPFKPCLSVTAFDTKLARGHVRSSCTDVLSLQFDATPNEM
eukprot:6443252-Amphidinium_carterae.1